MEDMIINHKDIIDAHKFSLSNKNTLVNDKKCGCFYCLKIYSPSEITEWWEDRGGLTGVCPNCGIDSVIGQSSGYPITLEFLKAMNDKWFSGYTANGDVEGTDC